MVDVAELRAEGISHFPEAMKIEIEARFTKARIRLDHPDSQI
jgi:hypothetical protein